MYKPKYWSNKGKFQKEYDDMYSRLVPDEGEASTTAGEIIRIISRMYYDIYNNGGCNMGTSYSLGMGAHLYYLVPNKLKEDAKKFCDESSVDLDDEDYMRFTDRFVDAAIQYAVKLEARQPA